MTSALTIQNIAFKVEHRANEQVRVNFLAGDVSWCNLPPLLPNKYRIRRERPVSTQVTHRPAAVDRFTNKNASDWKFLPAFRASCMSRGRWTNPGVP